MRAPRASALLLLLAVAAAGLAPAHAGDGAVVRVPVPDAGADARDAALRAALAALLVRRTGDRAVAERPEVRAVLERAAGLVQAYRYLRVPAPEAPQGAAAEAEPPAEAALALEVRFDAEAVERLLAELGLAVWPQPPPTLLAWIVIDDGRERSLLTDEGPGALRALAAETAAARGVSLLLPLWDVEDLSRVEIADLWGGFWDRILAASARYATAAALLGRVRPDRRGRWHGRWSVRLAGAAAPMGWTVETATLAGQIEAGLDGALDLMAARLARPAAALPEDVVAVRVEGVADLDGYARALARLESLPGVTAVQVTAVEGAALALAVRARGGRARLLEALRSAPGLELAATGRGATGPDTAAGGLRIRLRP